MGLRIFGYEKKQQRSVLKGFKYEKQVQHSRIRAFIYEAAGLVNVIVEDVRGRRLQNVTVTATNTVIGPTQGVTNVNGIAQVFIDGILPNFIIALNGKTPKERNDFANEQIFTIVMQAPIPIHQ
jgi:hypothetical protein